MQLTHLDSEGKAQMVDVSGKEHSSREAIAVGKVYMKRETLELISRGEIPKGDVQATARIAGIMAAKRTAELIPMCHNVPLDSVTVNITPDSENSFLLITAAARCTWKTGVEMEALTAVTAAALTIYDMCKAVDKEMVIGDVMLIKKTGGKSGDFQK